ncbi:MAG: hypothetical protein FD174_2189 [Geobacteraceae bacterium]|nr:MAG: hypothetical protein FD174_2189 [Geobacteraceae bacterium]
MRRGKIPFYAALAAFLLIMGLSSGPAWSAVGCDLNDPDRDVKRLFPGSTGYTAVTLEMKKMGGNKIAAQIEAKLRDKLHGLYETIDVPYTMYVIYANKKKIGYIHGVNQKGRYGGIQIFLVLDLDERIKKFYIQKMSGEYAGKFRDEEFAKQFIGLTLADFEQYDVLSSKGTGKVPEISNPAPEAALDFRYILRGTKKNLLFVNEFLRLSLELSPKKGASAK